MSIKKLLHRLTEGLGDALLGAGVGKQKKFDPNKTVRIPRKDVHLPGDKPEDRRKAFKKVIQAPHEHDADALKKAYSHAHTIGHEEGKMKLTLHMLKKGVKAEEIKKLQTEATVAEAWKGPDPEAWKGGDSDAWRGGDSEKSSKPSRSRKDAAIKSDMKQAAMEHIPSDKDHGVTHKEVKHDYHPKAYTFHKDGKQIGKGFTDSEGKHYIRHTSGSSYKGWINDFEKAKGILSSFHRGYTKAVETGKGEHVRFGHEGSWKIRNAPYTAKQQASMNKKKKRFESRRGREFAARAKAMVEKADKLSPRARDVGDLDCGVNPQQSHKY